MRILCLNLQKQASREIAEVFLKFSPRLQFRNKQQADGTPTGLIFIDITDTTHLFDGELALLHSVLELARQFYPDATAAIADTAPAAQVFANLNEEFICAPGNEKEKLGELSLNVLLELEGLHAWEKIDPVHKVISLFHILGIQSLAQIYDLRAETFRERWGKLGELLWKRLHHVEKQVVSPMEAYTPLTDYKHFDEPISLLSFLLYHVENSVSLLTSRMAGRAYFAERIQVTLHCEYSDEQHTLEVSLTPACRNASLFIDLIEQKLALISLENPIRQMEIHVVSVPEDTKQFNFFEPRTTDKERLQRLVHLFRQKKVSTGFLKINNEVFPEKSYALADEPEDFTPLETTFERVEGGIKKNPVYGEYPERTPRPTQLLSSPLKVSGAFLRRLKPRFLPHTERLETEWWKTHDQDTESRDYQFALSQEGQLMWMFKRKQQLYLHGFCD